MITISKTKLNSVVSSKYSGTNWNSSKFLSRNTNYVV